jgi:hypothetical protein
MSNPAESQRNGDHAALTLPAAEQRIAELERELAALRAEHAALQERYKRDRALLDSYMLEGMPRSEAEYQEMVANARPFRELLDELEQKYGLSETP